MAILIIGLVITSLAMGLLYLFAVLSAQAERRDNAAGIPPELRTRGSHGSLLLFLVGTMLLIVFVAFFLPKLVVGDNSAESQPADESVVSEMEES